MQLSVHILNWYWIIKMVPIVTRRPRRDVPPGIPGKFLCLRAPIVFLWSHRIPRSAAREGVKFKSPKDTFVVSFHRYLRKIDIKLSFNLIWIYFRAQIGWLGRGVGHEGIAPWLEIRGQLPGIPRRCPGHFLARGAFRARNVLGWNVRTGMWRYNRYRLSDYILFNYKIVKST